MSSRERNMLIVFGVIAVGALAFFLLTSGDGGPEEATAPTSLSSSPELATPPPVEEEEQEKPEEKGAPDDALDFLGGRDPFVPLVQEATSEAPTDDTTTGDTTGGTTTDDTAGDATTGDTTGDTTTGEAPGETATGGSSGGGGGSSAEEADVAFTGRPVTLVGTSSRERGDVARLEIGGETITVSEGQRFSRYYQLVSVRRHCARFLFGELSFILCE